MSKNKIYFISDIHLGLHPIEKSLEREKLLVKWLDEIKPNAQELFLMGDIFDFWHEYKHVVPKGFTRFLGKIAELADNGTKINFFTGNHDIWAYGYFYDEFGAEIFYKPIVKEFNGKRFFLGHGDGIGPGDRSYKLLKSVFTSKILQWLFARLHPNFALWLGKTWSKKSRYSKGIIAEDFAGETKELQIVFAKQMLAKEHFDYFIFGHRHIPYIAELGRKSTLINLGDWIYSFTYGVFDGQKFELIKYIDNKYKILRKSYDID